MDEDASSDSLAGLQGLYRDLCALIDLKLPVLDKLVAKLESRLDEFQALLDKKPSNDTSRQALASGKIQIGEEEYEVNEDFKNETSSISQWLDLDQLETARLFLDSKDEANELDRTQQVTTVLRFHRRREYILLCLRMIAKAALDYGDEEIEGQEALLKAAQIIMGVQGVNFEGAHRFWQKCLTSMADIEKWLQTIAEVMLVPSVVGNADPQRDEIMTLQRQSLTRQHESLAAICTHMVNTGFANLENFKALLAKAKTLEKHDIITIHYVPMIIRLSAWVAVESNTPTKDARALHDTLVTARDSELWGLRNLHAATITWWLAEYSGRYIDPNPQDPDLQNVKFEAEAIERSNTFLKALNDGAFHFMLSFSQDVRPTNWYDPSKTSMISFLLQEAAVLPSDSPSPEDFFKVLLMEQLQTFVDSFITNMPDTLRRLKSEEDDERKRLNMSFQQSIGEHPLHLERFLVIISYAYDGLQDAAEAFWGDKETNLYGFLQWAAKRQPTPRIAMFCEMLRAISTGEANAEAAHQFLLEEGGSASGRIRRTTSLCYTQIFNELIEFQRNIHEPKKTIQGGLYPPTQHPSDNIFEPESGTMLQSYLRLLAHLCRESSQARDWMLSYQELNLIGLYFSLCTDKVESHLRAAVFDAASSMLVNKSVPLAAGVWNAIDDWAISGFYVGTKPANVHSSFPQSDFWAMLADGYDESLALVRLLTSLMEPYAEEQGLNDALPFPEGLGSARRMPGVQQFIDFAVQHVFADRSIELQDSLQRNVMRWTCLQFVSTCLKTFNENLVVFANKSNIPVDSVVDSSSLAAYVTLHPFTRIMEWIFNDRVLRALFACSHQDVNEVDTASSDSPLVQSLMLSIEVMDLVMNLQATYLDIVRPVIKQQSGLQSSVSNPSLSSFEDAILNNLQIVVDLGLYCGTGHEALTIASLRLLQKFSSSRKLAVSPAGFGQRSSRSKIVGILEKDHESERIGRSLASLMQIREEEIEAGAEATGIVVKLRVLEFLNSCLSAVSTRPTLAHVLLGFSCENTSVHIADDSLWANGQSLFHAILVLAVRFPYTDEESLTSWQSDITGRSWGVLQKLWRSPLTGAIVMDELRTNELLFEVAPTLFNIDNNTLWDGVTFVQGLEEQAGGALSDFFCGSPSVALQNFLLQRAAFLDYECRELRLTVKDGMPTLNSRIQSVLLGSTIKPGEDPIPNHNIFTLFDFIEFEVPERTIPDQSKFLKGVNLKICQEEKNGVTVYSLPLLEQLFLLRLKAWRKENAYKDEQEEFLMRDEAHQLLALFTDYNRRAELTHSHKDILRSWVQLLKVTLQSCEFDVSALTAFILQTLQVILPKLELAYNDNIFTALELATLAEALIQKIQFDSPAFEKTRTGDFGNDRLSQLFRAALIGTYSPVSTVQLREYCYQICFRYIQGTFEKSTKGSPLGRHTLSTIKNCGSHLLEVICDDAYSGQGTCKVSALLLLSTFVAIATRQGSKYILDAFKTLNFIGVLVDNIKHIPDELKIASAPQVPILLSYYDAGLSLLLRICQTRDGSGAVLNAGLFQAIKESSIFDVDPDIGLEFDNPNALKKYYDLMLAVLRVINAVVVARGAQNEQSTYQALTFLKENRNTMVSIFKRSVNVGLAKDVGEDLNDLVDCFTVLVEMTGFLQHEDSAKVRNAHAAMFS
ncbi:nucleoporin Nup186/Nup192/Nup205 [Lophiotrema nucula]|uniref:Nucleoporin Nup186/Nup192/Nup205 n=1 Tax=Lophiotrema nucula TaxID=690887 RepID=A0A6A5Z1U8_9PLEO|nr:nucleoporin Nup186/Nup192/Nup205 [Lophiotrema nucula]